MKLKDENINMDKKSVSAKNLYLKIGKILDRDIKNNILLINSDKNKKI